MILTSNNNGLNGNNLPENGQNENQTFEKWSWRSALRGALNGFLIGGIAGAIIGAIEGGLSNKQPIALPPGEFESITSWVKNRFTPYFNSIITETNTVLENNFNSASLPQLNSIANRLCILKNYYSRINNDVLLSPEGLDFRYSLVEPYCSAIENLLRDKALSLNAEAVTAFFDSGSFAINILPQPQTGTISCTNYVIGGKNNTYPANTNTSIQPKMSDQPTESKNLSWLWITLAVGTVVLLWPNKDDQAENSETKTSLQKPK